MLQTGWILSKFGIACLVVAFVIAAICAALGIVVSGGLICIAAPILVVLGYLAWTWHSARRGTSPSDHSGDYSGGWG